MRKLGILLVAGVSLVFAGSAVAAGPPNCAPPTTPLHFTFNWAVIGTPAGALAAVNPNTAQLSAYACVNSTPGDPHAGQFTIAPADLSIPAATFKISGVTGTVQAALSAPAVGQLDPATGAMGMTADFTATLNVPVLNGFCTVDTGPQTYSTENANLFGGKRFPASADGSGFVTGAGAIAGGWSSLQSQTGSACALLSQALSSGSFWISRDIAPPATLAAKAVSASTKLKAGKSVKVKVTVTNSGVGPAQTVSVCVKVPGALKVKGGKCHTVAMIAAPGSTTVTFTLSASSTAKSHSYKITFSASSTGVTTAAARANVKVLGAKRK
jgi:hypothetical protein